MKTYKVMASGWDLDVESTTVPGTWVPVNGINSFEFGSKTNKSDVTTFDSDGAEESMITSRSKTLKVDGLMAYAADGTRDAGQTIVEELGELLGDNAFGNFRLTDPKGNVRQFEASVTIDTIAGGGNKDGTKFSFTVDVNGAVQDTPVLATAIELGDAVSLAVNQVKDIVPVFTPANTTDKAVTVTSSDKTKVAAIAFGSTVKVLGIAIGTATITVTTADGSNKVDTVVVTVS